MPRTMKYSKLMQIYFTISPMPKDFHIIGSSKFYCLLQGEEIASQKLLGMHCEIWWASLPSIMWNLNVGACLDALYPFAKAYFLPWESLLQCHICSLHHL